MVEKITVKRSHYLLICKLCSCTIKTTNIYKYTRIFRFLPLFSNSHNSTFTFLLSWAIILSNQTDCLPITYLNYNIFRRADEWREKSSTKPCYEGAVYFFFIFPLAPNLPLDTLHTILYRVYD